MKKIVLIAFGCLSLTACGPKRMGCGPYRRCEIKVPTPLNSEINKIQVS